MKKWFLTSLLSTFALAEETIPVLNSGDTADDDFNSISYVNDAYWASFVLCWYD